MYQKIAALLFALIERVITWLMFDLCIEFKGKVDPAFEYYIWGPFYEEYDLMHDTHVVGFGKLLIGCYSYKPRKGQYTIEWAK